MNILIGGHRGAGRTDTEDDPQPEKPAESTIESFRRAFNNGVDFVEVDAQETLDHKVLLTHADNLAHHVFTPTPYTSVGEANAADLTTVEIGRDQKGFIPSLEETLDFLRTTAAFNRASFCLNIELKNIREIQKDVFKPGPDSYYDSLLKAIKDNGFPLDKIVFSSFAVHDLVELKKCEPKARTGFLFWECEGGPELEIYPTETVENARYIYCTPQNIDMVYKLAKPDFIHPETGAITRDVMAKAAQYKMGINAWVWKEKPPADNDKDIARALALATLYDVDINFITDYIPATREAVKALRPPILKR